MMRGKKFNKSLFSVVLMAFLLFASLLIGVLMIGFLSADISSDLEKNNYRFYYSKIEQKCLEIERAMVTKWASDEMIAPVARILKRQYYMKGAEADRFDFNEETAVPLIAMLSEMNASGAMVVLGEGAGSSMSCLYLRDSNEFNKQANFSDISMVIGPADVAADLGISLSDMWRNAYDADETDFGSLYEGAVRRFREHRERGYWQEVEKDGERSIFYLRVLCDNDDEPFGFIGVEVRSSLMTRYLSYSELTASKKSGYSISKQESDRRYRSIFQHGPFVKSRLGESAYDLEPVFNNKFVTYSGDNYADQVFHVDDFVAIALPLRLYEKGSAFYGEERWFTIAFIPKEEFYIYSDRFRELMIILSLIASAISAVIATVLSRLVVKPLQRIVQDIRGTSVDGDLMLKHVQVAELDLLVDTIGKLTSDIRSNASRLEYIMQALELPILIVEQNLETNKVYKFGSLRPAFEKYAREITSWPISVAEFDELLHNLISTKREVDIGEADSDQKIYEFYSGKEIYFLKYISKTAENRIYHFIMDYTQEVRNKKRILYERDHDGITTLLNRYAFQDRVNLALTDRPDQRAAMVMWDLDDLKYVNDTYGHDYGDKYLKYAGAVLSTIQSDDVFVSRVSGDEFFAFIPYQDARAEVLEIIETLRRAMLDSKLVIGEYEDIRIRATSGIAWYPEDGRSFEELKRYADFAMYTAKHREKGTIAEFDKELYEGDSILITGREQFNAFIENREVDFAFQPIVDAASGEVFAYEALMRPTSAHITNVFDVMRIAKIQSKLKAIELLTWHGVLEKVRRSTDQIKNRYLFINSIASINLDDVEIRRLEDRYGDLFSRVVVEITESERLEYRSMEKRQKLRSRWGMQIAIDDFGAGYSSESMLLEVMPDFVKIDMTIIRNIHQDVSRQKIVENILDYARTRAIRLIAEGVETIEELRCLRRIGVHYVQGHYLAAPSLEIREIDPDMTERIRML